MGSDDHDVKDVYDLLVGTIDHTKRKRKKSQCTI